MIYCYHEDLFEQANETGAYCTLSEQGFRHPSNTRLLDLSKICFLILSIYLYRNHVQPNQPIFPIPFHILSRFFLFKALKVSKSDFQ